MTEYELIVIDRLLAAYEREAGRIDQGLVTSVLQILYVTRA